MRVALSERYHIAFIVCASFAVIAAALGFLLIAVAAKRLSENRSSDLRTLVRTITRPV